MAEKAEKSEASTSSVDENAMKEWEVARGVLSKFDELTHDVRKYGFTFVTTLMAAEALLLPSPAVVGTDPKAVTPEVKFAVIAATILLVVTMRVVEKNYELFQRAANTRALILERRLNLELTEIISDKYKRGHIIWLVTTAYSLFVVGVAIIGHSVLQGSPVLIQSLWLMVFVAIISMIVIARLGLRYPHGTKDWTLFPLKLQQSEELNIVITNLAPAKGEKEKRRLALLFKVLSMLSNLGRKKKSEDIVFSPGDTVCTLTREDGRGQPIEVKAEISVSIGPQDSHTWLWNTKDLETGKDVETGIYRLTPRGRTRLRRKILVTPRPKKKEDAPDASSRTRLDKSNPKAPSS